MTRISRTNRSWPQKAQRMQNGRGDWTGAWSAAQSAENVVSVCDALNNHYE